MDLYLKIKEYFEENLNWLDKKWAPLITMGSVVLYFFGYLTLRFHLCSMNVTSDYQFIDERYLFAGVNFFLYLFLSIPIVVLLIFILICIVYIFCASNKILLKIIAKLLPKNAQFYIQAKWENSVSYLFGPLPLLCTIILLTFLFIQIVMRKVLLIKNISFLNSLPDDGLSGNLIHLMMNSQNSSNNYFMGLIIVTGLTMTSWFYFKQIQFTQIKLKILHIFLGILILIQIILLPVSYGILINEKELPRISKNNFLPLKTTENAWLIWEGNKYMNFLVKDSQTNQTKVLTVPRDTIKQLSVEGTDCVFGLVYKK